MEYKANSLITKNNKVKYMFLSQEGFKYEGTYRQGAIRREHETRQISERDKSLRR